MTLDQLHALGLRLEHLDTAVPVLVVDATFLEHIERCRRFAYHLDVRRRATTGFSMDLWWGTLMHECWATWAGLQGSHPPTDTTQEVQFRYIDMRYAEREATWGPLDDGEYRTCGRAKDHIGAFNRHYREVCEDGPTVEVLEVERRFRHPLGVLEVAVTGMDRPVQVDWAGIRDQVVRDRLGRLWVVDWKTGTSWKEEWTKWRHGNSAQFKGYSWAAARDYGEPVAGVVIRSAIARKPLVRARADSEPRDEFLETALEFHPRQLEVWHGDALATIASFLRDGALGHWPQSGSSCGDYGKRCQYWDVCCAPTWADGEAWLESGAYGEYQWSPLVGPGEPALSMNGLLDNLLPAGGGGAQ